MTDRFLYQYEQDIEPGAGHSPVAGNRKVIIHTTETGPGTLDAVRNMWRGSANWGKGLAHFISEGRRFVQCLPLDTCAYTSKNGGIDANKAGCPIQIEVVHYANNPFSDEEYDALGLWIADLIRAGININIDACPEFYGPNDGIYPYLSTPESPVRDIINNQFGGYANFNGICGHQHLEGNDHWDPGKLDIHRLCDSVRNHLNPTQEEEMPQPMKSIFWSAPDSKWAHEVAGLPEGNAGAAWLAYESGIIKHIPSQDHLNDLKAAGVFDWGQVGDRSFDYYTLVGRKTS